MAISLIATTGKSLGPSGGTTTAIDTTGATLIVLGISSSGAPGSVTDSKGNTYTGLTAHSTAGTRHQLYYCVSPVVGTGHTFTTNASFSAMVVFAFAGAGAYTGQQNGAGGSSSPLSTGSVTPPANNQLVFTAFSASGISITTLNAPAGFTVGTVIPGVAASAMYAAGAFLVQGTAAAVNPQWSWIGSTGDAATSIAVFDVVAPAASVRTTQDAIELLAQPVLPESRVSQCVIEILQPNLTAARISQLVTELLSQNLALSSSGTGAVTIGHPLFAGVGTTLLPSFSGTGAMAIGHPVFAGAGTTTVPSFSGIGGLTIGPPALDGSGEAFVFNAGRAFRANMTVGWTIEPK